jgi:hypothetical protein
MATATATHTFQVQQLDRKYGLRIDLGTVTFGPQGELALVSAQTNFDGFLTKVIEAVNARPTLSVKSPPPEGGQPHAIYYVTVERTAPDLLDWMRKFLEQNYDLLLTEGPTDKGTA